MALLLTQFLHVVVAQAIGLVFAYVAKLPPMYGVAVGAAIHAAVEWLVAKYPVLAGWLVLPQNVAKK